MTRSAEQLLDEVLDRWLTSGPLQDILDVIADVWRQNLDRQEPDLGDDAMSLGILCSRNVMNRCVAALRDQSPHFRVRGGLTLEVVYAGRVMHLSKVSSQQASWDPSFIDWESSEVRINGARENAAAYSSVRGTLFEGANEEATFGRSGDPSAMRHLHLAWQGLADEAVRAYVGFPTSGPTPWAAVSLVRDSRPNGGGTRNADTDAPVAPWHDALLEPDLPMRAKQVPAAHTRNSA